MNQKQRQFAEYYAANPNATKAAIAAGYSPKTAYAQGNRLLKDAETLEYITQLQDAAKDKRIASIKDAKVFWSDVMNDPHEKTADRLKASELLVKSSGAFTSAVAIRGKSNDDEYGAAIMNNDGGDVVIYIPQMLSEEECQAPTEA